MLKKCDTSSFRGSNSLKRIISQNFWKISLTIVILAIFCSWGFCGDPRSEGESQYFRTGYYLMVCRKQNYWAVCGWFFSGWEIICDFRATKICLEYVEILRDKNLLDNFRRHLCLIHLWKINDRTRLKRMLNEF